MDTTYTYTEMLELVGMHFTAAFSDPDYTKWDWSLPMYLITGVNGWSEARLAAVVDGYHNGPARVR